jgi:glycosyltransferase involved in cell wall biosynthesis
MSSVCKVVILGTFAPDSPPGGVTTHCSRLVERLGESSEFVVRRVNVRLKGKKFAALLRSNPLIWFFQILFARLRGFSIFHFHTSSKNIPFLFLAPLVRCLGGRVLLSFHSGKIGADMINGGRGRRMLRHALFFSDVVVFMNKRESEIIAARFPKNAGKIKAIHPFVFPPQRPDTVKREAGFSIAVMGGWLRYYLLENALDSARELARAYPQERFNLKCALALFNIDFDYKTEFLRKVAESAGSPPNLKVEVFEDLPDPLAFLASVDVLVRSSSVDSFGLCVAEAAFLGKPAIATDVCRRVDGTYLYAPDDTAKLHRHLLDIYRRTLLGKLEKIEIDAREDAFPRMREIYLALTQG